jgi:hypothetical protein
MRLRPSAGVKRQLSHKHQQCRRLALFKSSGRHMNAGLGPSMPKHLLVASCETGRAVCGRAPRPIGSEPWFPAEGGAGACSILANADRPFGRATAVTRRCWFDRKPPLLPARQDRAWLR